jgi:MarR family transcriptional regulator, organic hydroperoxide resistance regulator
MYLGVDVDPLLLLDRQLCFALHRASRAVVKAYQPLLAELEVTYPQYLVLLLLWEQDGVIVKALGERLDLDSGTLTPLLRRLEARGLVTRVRSAEDEREVLVGLTAAGRRLHAKARRVPRSVLVKSCLTTPEAARLRGELHTLADRFFAEPNETASTRKKEPK